MELISSCSNPTTPFFTAPSSPSSSHHPYYNDYEDGDAALPHRLSLAFDHWVFQTDFTVIPAYDDRVVGDDETGYAGDFEFEFDGLHGKVSSASANDLFLEGKIRSLLTGGGSGMEVVPARNAEGGDRSCTTPSLRVCDILVQGEDEEEDGGEGNNSFMPAARDRMVGTESTGAATTTTTTCSVGYLSSLLPGMSLLRDRHNRNKSWSLKDFLFRSTSEGRGTSKAAELDKGRSPQETRGRGRRGRTMSAHELHYRENRMASEEMRRRTTLPFKPGFFACLGHGGARNVCHVSRPGLASFLDRSNR